MSLITIITETLVTSRSLSPVPPVIEEFKFDSKLQSGMRTRIYCNVAQGDQPVQLRWFKDGQAIEAASPFAVSVPGVRTRLIDEFSLALVIENLASASHNGNYSCVASNEAASVSHTATLVVNGESTRPSVAGSNECPRPQNLPPGSSNRAPCGCCRALLSPWTAWSRASPRPRSPGSAWSESRTEPTSLPSPAWTHPPRARRRPRTRARLSPPSSARPTASTT